MTPTFDFDGPNGSARVFVAGDVKVAAARYPDDDQFANLERFLAYSVK